MSPKRGTALKKNKDNQFQVVSLRKCRLAPPLGPTRPLLCVVRVEGEEARVWMSQRDRRREKRLEQIAQHKSRI